MTKTFYIVRNKEGKFLRSKGYGGSGECWVDDLDKAKVWSRPGPAKAQVTWWLMHYPVYGVPEVIPLIATLGTPLSLGKGYFRKMHKNLEDLLKEKDKLQKALDHLQEDAKNAQSPSVREHARVGTYHYISRMDDLKAEESKLRQVIQTLEAACP